LFETGKTYKPGADGWEATAASPATNSAREAASALATTGPLAGNVTVNGSTATLNDNVTATANDPLTVPAGVTVAIPDGSDLIVNGANALNVVAGATVAVDDGGTLDLVAANSGKLDGTVEVGAGATLIDRNNGGSIWGGNAAGEFVIHSGATAWLGGTTPNSDLMVSHPGDSNSGSAFLLLTSGTLTLKKTSYVLNGVVTLQKSFPTLDLTIKNGATLTIAGSMTLGGFNNTTTITVEANGGIVNSGTTIFEDSATNTIQSPLPAGTYTWSGTEWIKQP
jgi:hypothetical protein